jgi:hypothetical protein
MPTPFRTFSVNDTQLRTSTYKRGQSVGQAIQELVDVENGMDVYVNPTTRAITTRAPTRSPTARGAVRVRIRAANLANAPQTDDGTSTAEYITTVGANGVGRGRRAEPDRRARRLRARGLADALRRQRRQGSSAPTATPSSSTAATDRSPTTSSRWPTATCPRLYDDFELGDKVYLSVDAGALKVERQAIRVFSVGIEVDAQRQRGHLPDRGGAAVRPTSRTTTPPSTPRSSRACSGSSRRSSQYGSLAPSGSQRLSTSWVNYDSGTSHARFLQRQQLSQCGFLQGPRPGLPMQGVIKNGTERQPSSRCQRIAMARSINVALRSSTGALLLTSLTSS